MSNPILGAALIGIKIRFLVCLRADVSYFLCCTRKTKEIGDIRVLLSTTRNRN